MEKKVNAVADYGEIRETVVYAHNARSSIPFSTVLVEGGTVDLATVKLDLSNGFGGVLLQGEVNWSAAFTIPPSEELDENGFAEVTFQLVREGEVIYQVTQTLRQKDFGVAAVTQTTTTYEVASLLYFDNNSLLSQDKEITYTLRAADIALFTQTGVFSGDEVPVVTAAAGAVTLIAQETEAWTRSESADENNEPEINGVEKVFINQSSAPMPATIPLVTALPEGETVELACLEVGADDKEGIFLTALVNWCLRVTSNEEPAKIISSGLANVTFELLRNGTIIYRTTQTAVQTFIAEATGSIETATFEIADLSYLDMPLAGEIESGINTYILRASNTTIIDPVMADGSSVSIAASVGPVTLAAQLIERDNVKKKSKHRHMKRRR
ncbi:MAG: hypothetical protein GX348_11455 [Veillonellaceae bacterium]|nr:hypothetical protein [Veillonellaceae bacterium]